MSSLGKGLTSSALGAILEGHGYRVKLQKFEPYLNVDPGTMSPLQHGEVYVTEDGAETETASEAEEDIEVEITEADPETGEDVTDLEVEIVEEETADDAEA